MKLDYSVTGGRSLPELSTASILSLSAWLALSGLTVLAIVRPVIPYDSWWYHLPFSSMIWGIGGGAKTFHLDDFLYQRWEGFPLIWETVQGAFWRATGSVRYVIIPQILFCLFYFNYVRHALGVPLTWVILGFFACPMLLVHFEATQIDLASGLGVTLLFFGLSLLVADAQSGRPGWSWARVIGVVTMAAVAGNTKYQGLIACLAVSVVIFSLCLAMPQLRARSRLEIIALLVLANLVAGTAATQNLILHENPFYPVEVRAFGQIIFEGPELPSLGAEPPSYLLSESREISLPGPLNFVLSATELDWTLRGVAPWYNIDAVSGRSPRRGPPSRTGGWGGIYVLLNIGLLAAQAMRVRRLADDRQQVLVIGAVLLTIVTACLPRAHELRYWLYIPLVLMPVNLRFLYMRWGRNNVPVQALLLGVAIYGMALAFLSPKSGLLLETSLPVYGQRPNAPPGLVESLSRTGQFCFPSDEFLFRYSAAVTGLPGTLSRNIRDCP